jgi:hypothetical protein
LPFKLTDGKGAAVMKVLKLTDDQNINIVIKLLVTDPWQYGAAHECYGGGLTILDSNGKVGFRGCDNIHIWLKDYVMKTPILISYHVQPIYRDNSFNTTIEVQTTPCISVQLGRTVKNYLAQHVYLRFQKDEQVGVP